MDKDKVAWKVIFDEFLKEHGCHDAFYKNCKENTLVSYRGLDIFNESIGAWVLNPFDWDMEESFNGLNWMEIDDNWEDVVDNKQFVKNTRLARKLYPKAPVYKNYILVDK